MATVTCRVYSCGWQCGNSGLCGKDNVMLNQHGQCMYLFDANGQPKPFNYQEKHKSNFNIEEPEWVEEDIEEEKGDA